MEAGAKGEPARRFELVDAMRGIAALSVLVFHVSFSFPAPTSQLGQFVSQRNSGPPITAVVLFFLISGFVLYRPFVIARYDGAPMPPLFPYAVRRAARIIPAYWVALVIISLVLSLHYVFTAGGLIRYFGFLQLYARNASQGRGIPVAWTLCVEVSFYIALPLFALAVRRLGRRRSVFASELLMCAALLLVALVWGAVVIAAEPRGNPWTIPLLWSLPGSLDFFAAGMALAVLTVELTRRPQQPRWLPALDRAPVLPWLLAIAVLFVGGQVANHIDSVAGWTAVHELKLVGCALLLVPVLFGDPHRGLLRRALHSRPMLWLGMVSYGIYLWHFSLLQKLGPHLVPHGKLYTTVALTLITVAVAALSYYIVERPSQLLARRYLRARAAPGQVVLGGLSAAAPAPTDSGS